jgi:serine/threonine protein kinase/WD40 repeat protein
MSRERDIFLEALEQPSSEARAAFIERATVGDPNLRESVETLLANDQSDTFLEKGAAEAVRKSVEAARKTWAGEEQIGETIGRYKLLENIGEGGFGVVYRAEQNEPVRRQVALKVIKLGMDTKTVVARFEAERQALALMDHPSIARVLDGGATPNGRPYFVMELVRGVRITEYCEANQTPLEERLLLFIQLCHAIQHAHQKGVIHRDLKPSNVLVTNQDGKPTPKVIDFGIAKAIEEPLTAKTVLTSFHAFIGTPAYTSPEQAEMTGSDVDTRSDIYSLGVLLYELLTGVTPFDAKELTASGLDGMRRMIREVEPPTPSTRLRRALVGKLASRGMAMVDNDLDSIVMKCLEKDRARRYSTAQELVADLQRYLNEEPVLARPQSATYRLHKVIRRHRAAFAAATAILVTFIAGSTVSLWQAFRATRAEHDAEQRRQSEEVLRQKAEQGQRRAELNEYIADINLAHKSILAGNLARAGELLARHRTTGAERFEWRYLSHAAEGDDHKLLAQEPSSVLSLANSSEWLVVGLADSVRIYDSKTVNLVKSLAKPGSSVALSRGNLLATASKGTVRVWRCSDWGEAFTLPECSAPIAFSPDGQRLAANSATGVRIFNSSDGKLVAQIPNSMPPFAFSPSGEAIAVDTRRGITLWEVNPGKMLRMLEHSEGIFTNPAGWMRDRQALAFSPDGFSVVAARNTLQDGSIFALDAWSVENGQKIASMPGYHHAVEHSGAISSIAFAPDGPVLASGSWDHSIRVWDLATRQCIETLHGNSAEVWTVAFTPDGQGIISGTKDGTVRLWPTNATPKEKFYAGSFTPLKFSKDGRVLAVLNAESKLALLNVQTGEPETPIQLDGKQAFPFSSRALSDDLHVLAEPLADGGIRVWDLQSEEAVNLGSHGQRKAWWTSVAPDGSTVVAGGGQDAALWWNLRDPSEAPVRIEAKGALFSRNGLVLVALHDRAFKVWDAKTRAPWTEPKVEAGFSFTSECSLSEDGRILAVGSNPVMETENAIRLWDTRPGHLLGVCRGHTQGVRWLAFAPDGETLASVSDDSTFRLWDVQTQQELLSIQRLADPIRNIVFSPNGKWLGAKTVSGLLLLDGSPERDPKK